jgi:thiosulfate dehydrogenase
MHAFFRLLIAGALVASGCQAPEAQRAAASPSPSPSPPSGELGAAIALGERIVRETGVHAKGYVGNELSCASCHIDAGRRANAAPFTGVYAGYPQYRARSGEVTTLEDRVNECFERSMNGKPLPRDSREMRALIAYMAWTSHGVPVGRPEGLGIAKIASERAPDAARGKVAYAASCATCHGADGQGVGSFPPLWGESSFNVGAGMARLDTAAAFIKWNMPKGREGTLSNEEAYDIAAYVLSHPRPDFAGKRYDWPKGGKPSDAAY